MNLARQLIESTGRRNLFHAEFGASMKFSRFKIANCILAVTAAVVLVVLAFHVKADVRPDSVAILKTSGMTCGSCSKLIRTGLETVKGVAVTEVDVEGGWVIVGYNTQAVKPETLADKVRESGFSSTVYAVLTPEQFKKTTGRYLGKDAEPGSGCCGGKGGCGSNKQN
jgi:copper chaperone CopZ